MNITNKYVKCNMIIGIYEPKHEMHILVEDLSYNVECNKVFRNDKVTYWLEPNQLDIWFWST